VIRVLIADDEALVRTGLRMILENAPDMSVVGEAVDGARAVAAVERLRPDVVLMDVRMPALNGVDATARICAGKGFCAEQRGTRVLILTTFDLDEYVYAGLRAGASGFLLKDTRPAELVEAVRRVAAGEPILSPSVTRRLMRHAADAEPSPVRSRRDEARERLAVLSEREREVALAVAEGLANAEIAAHLFMSVATVKAYVSRLLTKLGLGNRVQVALLVNDAQLAEEATDGGSPRAP
jgi:DNA-binding NarL/FixJ family response regulator